MLTLEDPYRFGKSRSVGAYLGLAPSRDQSGDTDLQKRISKEGDEMLRDSCKRCSLHLVSFRLGLGPKTSRREDSLRGGKNAKKRAALAVARKLAVLLHSSG